MTLADIPDPNREYNGWRNYQTWNVALWIDNDPGMYALARDAGSYKVFLELIEAIHEETEPEGLRTSVPSTPDDVALNDGCLDIEALDEMIRELEA